MTVFKASLCDKLHWLMILLYLHHNLLMLHKLSYNMFILFKIIGLLYSKFYND